jgi:hypothetical protein
MERSDRRLGLRLRLVVNRSRHLAYACDDLLCLDDRILIFEQQDSPKTELMVKLTSLA